MSRAEAVGLRYAMAMTEALFPSLSTPPSAADFYHPACQDAGCAACRCACGNDLEWERGEKVCPPCVIEADESEMTRLLGAKCPTCSDRGCERPACIAAERADRRAP